MAKLISHACFLLAFTSLVTARASARPKLFDSTNTGALEYTWTAWVERNGSYVCGASIITNKWVMTSGDCVRSFVDNNEGGSFNIYVGDYNTSVVDTNEVVIKSCNVLYNKNYNSTTNQNNLGMMELEVPLNFSSEVNPVPAYSSSKIDIKILKQSSCFISGFGLDGKRIGKGIVMDEFDGLKLLAILDTPFGIFKSLNLDQSPVNRRLIKIQAF